MFLTVAIVVDEIPDFREGLSILRSFSLDLILFTVLMSSLDFSYGTEGMESGEESSCS